jgi:hypothetical protein
VTAKVVGIASQDNQVTAAHFLTWLAPPNAGS